MRSVGCVEPFISTLAYHANDPPHGGVLRANLYLRAKLQANLLPYGIFVWPEALRRCLVDEHDRFAFLVVGLGKESTCDEPRGKDMEKIRRCYTQLGGWSSPAAATRPTISKPLELRSPVKGVFPPPIATSFTPGTVPTRRSISLTKILRFSCVG